MKTFTKIIEGFVVQEFEVQGGKVVCTGQNFEAGDMIDYVHNGVKPEIAAKAYFPFEMEQPK